MPLNRWSAYLTGHWRHYDLINSPIDYCVAHCKWLWAHVCSRLSLNCGVTNVFGKCYTNALHMRRCRRFRFQEAASKNVYFTGEKRLSVKIKKKRPMPASVFVTWIFRLRFDWLVAVEGKKNMVRNLHASTVDLTHTRLCNFTAKTFLRTSATLSKCFSFFLVRWHYLLTGATCLSIWQIIDGVQQVWTYDLCMSASIQT